jgi:hypothetical protein
LVWIRFWVISGLLWLRFWIVSGSVWLRQGYFGVALDSFWVALLHFKMISELFLLCFGSF